MKHDTLNYFKRLSERLREIDDKPYELFQLEDLSHALRMISEARDEIAKDDRFKDILLPVWKPTKQLKKKFKRNPYLICFFHRAVPIPNPPEKNMRIGVGLPTTFFPNSPGYGIYGTMRVRHKYLDIDRLFTGYTKGTPKFADPYHQIQMRGYVEWLDSSLFLVNWIDEIGTRKRVNFSRSKFIHRIASSFGGSHPSGNAWPTDENKVIEFLLSKSIGGFPVAYIILYSVAFELMLELCPSLCNFLEQPTGVEPPDAEQIAGSDGLR